MAIRCLEFETEIVPSEYYRGPTEDVYTSTWGTGMKLPVMGDQDRVRSVPGVIMGPHRSIGHSDPERQERDANYDDVNGRAF